MKTESQAQKAYDELRKKILSNQLPPGTRLKEDFWAQKTGVSRIAVREALVRLFGEGLLVRGEKAGYFIAALEASDVHEIRELREILEVGALKLVVRRVTRAQTEQLEKICNDFTTMVSKGYFAGACEADIKFHETLIALSGNEKLIKAYRNSHIPLFHQRLTQSHQTLDDYDLTDREHRAIVKAIRDKNGALAEKCLVQHIARGESAVLE